MTNALEPYTFGIYKNRQKYDDAPIVYDTFSGTDISAMIVLPNKEPPLHLGELQTISYSIHRENKPIRVLGRVNPKGFVKGPRTIAGSLIFTVFNAYAFYRLQQYSALVHGSSGEFGLATEPMFPLADMLPPFDVVLTFSNEYGRFARMRILGVTIVDEGGTMSVDDLVTEQTYTYMARGIQPLTSYIPENLMPTLLPNESSGQSTNTISFGGNINPGVS